MEEDEPSICARLEADSGLDHLLPLLSLLQKDGLDAVCRLFIRDFQNAQYVKDNLNHCVKRHMTLYEFISHVLQRFKSVKEGKKSKKCNSKRSPSLSQTICSNQHQQHQQQQHQQHQQQHHHQQQHQHKSGHLHQGQRTHSPQPGCSGHQHKSQPISYTNLPQETVRNQYATQHMEDLQSNRPSEIPNLPDKEKLLVQLTVDDLLRKDEDACQVLYELDLNFVLNAVLNKHINFILDKRLIEALNTLKKVRQTLVHAKYNFTEHDFENNLTRLAEALGVLHKELHLPAQLLQQRVEVCQEEAKSGNKSHEILSQLRCEAHPHYSAHDNFVPPNITCTRMLRREVIEDVHKYVESQYVDPIVLCGEQKEEKDRVMESLASKAANGSRPRYKLVLFLKESHRRSYHHQATPFRNTKKAVQGFQDHLFTCLANLVPHTVYRYGLDIVKKIVKTNQRDILFLINWNLSVLGPVQSEMQQGSWVMTCDAEPPQGSWQVLRLEPYTETQVEKMLCCFDNSRDLLRCYHNFDSKDILCSMDMIKIFCEVSETISTGSDFEVVEKYVSRSLQCIGSDLQQSKQDLHKLGRLAFNALFTKKYFFSDHVNTIQNCLCESFLSYIEGKGWSFKHAVVRDLLAARYVVANSSDSCKNWVKKDESISAFQRVFKFVCCMWFQDTGVTKEYLIHMEIFLRKLWHVPDKKKIKYKEKETKNSDMKLNQTMENEMLDDQSKHKHPFDGWNFLLELDEACLGEEEILQRIVSILSDHPCWCFNASDCLDSRRLTRLEKILKKVSIEKRNPLIIKLKSNSNVTSLTELWRKFRGIQKLYDCVEILMTIEGDDSSHLTNRDKLADLLKTVADTQVPLYICRYKGPVFSSRIPNFRKCVCLHQLSTLDVSVYDVKSLCDVMACGALPSLTKVFIKVDLNLMEQTNLNISCIEIPPNVSVHITFEYFPNIQKLLNSFKCCDRLYSLSIHDLYVFNGFALNLSEFSHLKSLNIRFKPELSEDSSRHRQALAEDRMQLDVTVEEERMRQNDDTSRLSRLHWLLQLITGLSLPCNLERLLLRNTDFLNDSNQNLVNEFFKKYNINRLLVLDTQLSLTGVGKILCAQTEARDDVNPGGAKRQRRNESSDIRELAAKRSRISREQRDALKWKKPSGKEVVITSVGKLCTDCECFPCMCSCKVDRDWHEGSNTYERMIELINDMYCCRVQSFSYSFNQSTIRKDLCGDLRVESIMKCLTDSAVSDIESRSYLVRFFLPLLLAQCVTLEKTELSPDGVENVAQYLNHIKSRDMIEPFSLIIETCWHPLESCFAFSKIKCFLKTAEYLSVVHYRCSCTPRCFHVKKTFKGEIEDVV